jgi:hypothetical protein
MKTLFKNYKKENAVLTNRLFHKDQELKQVQHELAKVKSEREHLLDKIALWRKKLNEIEIKSKTKLVDIEQIELLELSYSEC